MAESMRVVVVRTLGMKTSDPLLLADSLMACIQQIGSMGTRDAREVESLWASLLEKDAQQVVLIRALCTEPWLCSDRFPIMLDCGGIQGESGLKHKVLRIW